MDGTSYRHYFGYNPVSDFQCVHVMRMPIVVKPTRERQTVLTSQNNCSTNDVYDIQQTEFLYSELLSPNRVHETMVFVHPDASGEWAIVCTCRVAHTTELRVSFEMHDVEAGVMRFVAALRKH